MNPTTTIQQLGGNAIFAMAFDARKSTQGPEGLFLRIARGLKALSGATHVRVTLEVGDVYTIETVKVTRSFDVVPLRKCEGVYGDSIRERVEQMTGLRLTLGTAGTAS